MSNDDDETVAGMLIDQMNVPDLRELCSENDVSRPRGASKAQTVDALVDQAPEASAAAVGVEVAKVTPGYVTMCPCGLESEHDERDGAISAAKDHLSGCKDGLAVRGLGGLNVWSEESGARTWMAGAGDVAFGD